VDIIFLPSDSNARFWWESNVLAMGELHVFWGHWCVLCWNVKMLLCIKSWNLACSFKRLFVPQNLKSYNPTLNHPHYQTNLLMDWNGLVICCVALHPIQNTWIVSLSIILVKLWYFIPMTKHLACKLGQWFFLEVQRVTPITKHIFILNILNLFHGQT